jgi:branched-chain amino acid transport system permease protein
MESIFIVSIVILGGAGNIWGPVLGAIVLVILPEFLRFVGIPTSAAANIRQILYGLALLACMLWRPQGLIGEYAFGREAKPE